MTGVVGIPDPEIVSATSLTTSGGDSERIPWGATVLPENIILNLSHRFINFIT